MISRPCDSVGDMLHSKEVRPCYPDGFVQKATEERSCCSDLGMQKVEEPRPCDPDGSTHKALEARPCDTHGGVKQAPEIRLARAAYINECRDSADLAPKLSKNGPLVAPSVRRLHSLPNLMINIDDATDKSRHNNVVHITYKPPLNSVDLPLFPPLFYDIGFVIFFLQEANDFLNRT